MLGADKSERIINGKADSYGSTDDRSGNLLSDMENRERSDMLNGGKRKNTASCNDVTEGPKDGYLICNKWLSLFFACFSEYSALTNSMREGCCLDLCICSQEVFSALVGCVI